MKIERQIIRNLHEQCTCTDCGAPLLTGDQVFLVDYDPYCSMACAKKAAARLQDDERPRRKT